MKRLNLLFVAAVLFLLGCASPPPVAERVESEAEITTIEIVPEKVILDGPVATASVVLGGYPEPEAQVIEEETGYPEPEPAESNLPAGISGEGDVEVVFVSARNGGDGTWSFAVTLEHADNGWEDYADGWDVVLPDGTVIKPTADSPFTRLLAHPHDNEQPFTRSQSGIVIPANVTAVYVRGHELVEGYSAQVVEVDLTADSGDRFEVTR